MNRTDSVDWAAVRADLDRYGCGLTGPLLSAAEAADIAALYTDDERFRSTIDMARYRFGEGEYRYFAEPLPDAKVGHLNGTPPERRAQRLYRGVETQIVADTRALEAMRGQSGSHRK